MPIPPARPRTSPSSIPLEPVARASAIDRRGRRFQYQLVERQVQPASELEPGLAYDATGGESHAFVQLDAHFVGGVDAADHDVIVLALRRFDHGLQQRTSQALAAEACIDVYRVLDGVLVRGTFAELSVRREAQ